MKDLASNKDLYAYLVALSTKLKDREAKSLAAIVHSASRQAAGLSNEFLGESRIALRKVYDSDEAGLSGTERVEMAKVLETLTAALDRRRSAG